jgi:small subunit ribosomal protein S3
MGRKVHPVGFRLGINQPWGGRWFAEGNTYRQQLHQDFAIRNLLTGKFQRAEQQPMKRCANFAG